MTEEYWELKVTIPHRLAELLTRCLREGWNIGALFSTETLASPTLSRTFWRSIGRCCFH
jgi:hypothetical protein